MKVKNLTAFPFGFKVTSRRPPQPELMLAVRATFVLGEDGALTLPEGQGALAQGALTGELFRDEDDERAGTCLYPGDLADFKPRADVLLKGTCHTPGGRPLAECPVRFAVGAWSKVLRVVGPRVWVESVLGAIPSEPVPFTEMPLGYTQSFGGPGYAPNPVGRGFDTAELPNVESPAEPIRARDDRPAPAGFGPLSSAWHTRRAKLGSAWAGAYRRERAPYFAEDFDWSYFNSAPPDQQISYLRGDEEISFHNLRPKRVTLASRLPALRVRAFVNDTRGRFREVRMNLDTLFVDLDELRITLVWRGVEPVFQDDLHDVRTALIASEPLAERPQPEAHYRGILEAFERDPIAESAAAAMNEALESLGGAPAPTDASAAAPARDDPLSALLRAKMGPLAAVLEQPVARAVERLGGAAAKQPNVHLSRAIERALRSPRPRIEPPSRGAPLRDARIQKPIRKRLRALAELRDKAQRDGRPLPPGLDRLDEVLRDPRLAAFVGPEKPLEEPGPGLDLAGRDLSGRNLRDRDLSGANLEGALLAGADLRGARLEGTNLRHAILSRADLRGANLEGAKLIGAHASELKAARAVLARASLDQAMLEDADLEGADLSRVEAERCHLSRANLCGANLQGIKLERCFLEGVKLRGADLRYARLLRCMLIGIAAEEVSLVDAVITRSSLAAADLRRARLLGIRGEHTVWSNAKLEGADLGHAVLPHAHFAETNAEGARFHGADLRSARFHRASLGGANFARANLFGADFGKAELSRASFRGANLYGSIFRGAAGAGADFEGANLRRSTLEGA